MNRLRDYNLNAFLVLIYIFILLMVILSGCTTQNKVNKWLDTKPKEKTEQVVGRYLKLNELYAATFCDEAYPIQEQTETSVDTLKIPVIVKGDSIPCPPVTDVKTGKVYTPMVKCPDVSYFQTTIKTLEKTTKESSAKADRYRLELAGEQRQHVATQKSLTKETEAHTATQTALDERTTERNRAYWMLGVFGFAAFGFLAFKVFRR